MMPVCTLYLLDEGSIIRRLVAAGAKVNATDDVMGQTPLHKAIQSGMTRNVEVLMINAADPNKTDRWGETPLHYAAHHNDVFLWYVLTASHVVKPDIFISNRQGQTPMDVADKCWNNVALSAMRHLADDWDN